MKNITKILFLLLTSLAGAAEAVTDTFTASGTWTAPTGVTSVTVEVWGGGGAGGGNPTTVDGGGGGGGGGYSMTANIAVIPGNVYTVTVGAGGIAVVDGAGGAGGDSWFATAGTIFAKGGAGGAVPVGGAGGLGGAGGAAATGIGATRFSGGNGGTGRNSNTGRGGPGGSSAGTAADGTSGALVWATATAAAPPAGGGIGGNGGNANGQSGFAPAAGTYGGGGGGGAERNTAGGNGAGGKVAITYTPPPTVVSINCAAACTTNAASVSWTVVFDQSVTGVDAADFVLMPGGGVAGASITGVVGGGTTWTVTANTGTGAGTLGLNLVDDDSIQNGVFQPLGGAGAGNGSFTGQVHTLDRTAPVVSSIVRVDPTPTALASVSWTVTFSESVSGVDAADFALVQAGGISGALITAVTPVSGTTYTVTATTGTGAGTLGLSLADDDSIIDAASNPLGGAGAGNGNFTGEVYSVVRPVTVTASPSACINVAGIGTVAWNPATLAGPLISDNIYATASVDGTTTNFLQCTGYGFAIPAGATINGITVNVERKTSGNTVLDAAMRLVKDVAGVPTIQTIDRSTLTNYTTADVIEAHGGAADLWGAAWTAADINTANFGAAFAATKPSAAGAARTVSVDHMQIAVTYTLQPPATVLSISRAGVSPTSAATVSWTVIFDQSVTGVDATAFGLVASGVSGAFITTVSGSGTTWTVTANTGIGSGTLGLNQTGPGSVAPPLSGTFTGEVYTIASTPSLAEYHMDEASWNGTANEVADSSGSGNHAQAFNSASTVGTTPAIAGSPGTCRYGVFDDGGTITQGYVQTPLPDLNADFTVTAWIRTTDNTIAGQRILIDDQSNSGGYGLSLGDSGVAGQLRLYSRAITPIIFDSTYTIANNTWYFVAAVVDFTSKKRSIYVFDTSGTLLGSDTEAAAWTGTWGTDAGPVSIGAEINASGELPATFHFRGNLDEVRVYQKVLSQSALAAVAAQRHACAVSMPDHLEIQSTGTGVTCAPSTLTVVACADVTCATPYTLGVSGTLSATGTPAVNWDSTTGGAVGAGFVIPVGGSSVTKNVQVTTPGSVAFGVFAAAPAPINQTTCNFGSPPCTFTAADAGFLVSAPGHVAETVSALTVQAVKKADNSLSCIPAFASVAKAVNLKCAYVNPVGGTLPVRVGGVALNAGNSVAAACDASGANVALNFDASGIATPALLYADVGRMSVTATYAGAAGTLDAGLVMIGASSFIAAPASFSFSNITAGPIKAGDSFGVTVTALNAAGNAAPNFGNETTPEGVTLGANLISPAGGNNPALGNNVIAGGMFANGAATVNNLSWGEVGNIELTAALTSADYLASGVVAATGTSATVGRFIPDHFDTAVVATATTPMPCPIGLTCPVSFNGFIYSGQPFSVQVIARNLAGGTTANYDGTAGFSRNVTLSAWNALGGGVQNPGPGALANNAVASASFISGVGTTATPAYAFNASPTTPTDIYVRADEPAGADGVSSLRGASSIEGGVKVVSGRVRIGNAHGSELLALPMAATVQYFNGTNWLTSATDSVTSLTLGVANYQCKTGCPWTTTPAPAGGAITAGVLNFILSRPAGGGTGSADVSIGSPNYLLAGSNGAGTNPSNTARATFGVYKGGNEFIYLREVY